MSSPKLGLFRRECLEAFTGMSVQGGGEQEARADGGEGGSSAAGQYCTSDGKLGNATPVSSKIDKLPSTHGNDTPETVDLKIVVSVQSMLNEFTKVNVRADVINNKFAGDYGSSPEEMLQLIDEARALLSPPFAGHLPGHDKFGAAARHMAKMLSGAHEPVMKMGQSWLTYATLREQLKQLSCEPYWLEKSNNGSHFHNSADAVGPLFTASTPASNSSRHKYKPDTKHKRSDYTDSSSDDTSSSASSSDSSKSSSSEHSEKSSTCFRKKRDRHDSRDFRDTRGVVTPPKFTLEGQQSLKDYLKSYETYFSRKFKGDDYDKSQELSRFLEGDLLGVYHALGGRMVKYPELKQKLLRHYKKLKLNDLGELREQLNNAKVLPNESVEVFSLRLTNIAARAYPRDKKEQRRQLRSVFLKALPADVASKITDAERLMKPLSSRRHLKFDSIIEMAKDFAKDTQKSKHVTWTVGEASCDKQSISKVNNDRAARKPHVPMEERRSPVQETPHCTHCGKSNHSASSCWRAHKRCLICGENHRLQSCPKFDPNYATKRRPGRNGGYSGIHQEN